MVEKHVALENDGWPPEAAEFVGNVSHCMFVKHHFVAKNHCQTSHLAVCHYLVDISRKMRDSGPMIHQIWRLSEPGEDNLGPAMTSDGLVLGRTPLLERREGSFVVRERQEIQRLLSRAYRINVTIDRLMSGLASVASALNTNDSCLARIAAVHLRLPDLPDTAAPSMEAEDILIKSAVWKSASQPREILKASPDDPKHPGWPAGTPGGRGGKFRPKDGSADALAEEIKNRISRRSLKMNLIAALHIGVEALANLIPGLDVAADVALLATIARTLTEYRELAIEAAAALAFVQNAPYSLEDLQASSDYKEFSNYDAFVKGRLDSELLFKYFGSAGDGSEYHHLVTQGGANEDNPDIPQSQLQNTDNIIILPTLLHEMVSDEYLRPAPDSSGMTLYDWLQTQPYEVQREYGLKILRDLHILK